MLGFKCKQRLNSLTWSTRKVSHESETMIFDYAQERSVVKTTSGHPVGKLIVPYAVVATQQLSVPRSQIRDHVSIRESEVSPVGLSRVLKMFSSNMMAGVCGQNSPISCCLQA